MNGHHYLMSPPALPPLAPKPRRLDHLTVVAAVVFGVYLAIAVALLAIGFHNG